MAAYKNPRYSQIPKFIEFWNRSTDSIYAHACDINNRFLSPLFAVDNMEMAVRTLKGDDASIGGFLELCYPDLGVFEGLF